jgi:hypothetical protein
MILKEKYLQASDFIHTETGFNSAGSLERQSSKNT